MQSNESVFVGRTQTLFTNPRYISRGILDAISLELQTFIWGCIDRLKEEKDYLQVFDLSGAGKRQTIIHHQEVPPYKCEHEISTESVVNTKVFVIDDGCCTTMILAEEY